MTCTLGVAPQMGFQLRTVLVLSSVVALASQTQDVGQLQAMYTSGNFSDFSAMIPSTPRPSDVNCYVDVELTETVGGRCVRFGRSRMWSCQSGIHLQLSHDCERQSLRKDRTKH